MTCSSFLRLALACILVAGSGASLGCGDGAAEDTGAGGWGGGGASSGGGGASASTAVASSSTVAPEIRVARITVEQGVDRSTDTPVAYASAEAWFAEQGAVVDDPACEGMEEGACVLLAGCPAFQRPDALFDVGAVRLEGDLLDAQFDRRAEGQYTVTFSSELGAQGDTLVAAWGAPPTRFELPLALPAGVRVTAPSLRAPIPRDQDLVVDFALDGTADEVQVWIGDALYRIECRFPSGGLAEGSGVVPSALLDALANAIATPDVLAVAFTEIAGQTLVGAWDVTWRVRDVELASPVALE